MKWGLKSEFHILSNFRAFCKTEPLNSCHLSFLACRFWVWRVMTTPRKRWLRICKVSKNFCQTSMSLIKVSLGLCISLCVNWHDSIDPLHKIGSSKQVFVVGLPHLFFVTFVWLNFGGHAITTAQVVPSISSNEISVEICGLQMSCKSSWIWSWKAVWTTKRVRTRDIFRWLFVFLESISLLFRTRLGGFLAVM